VQRSEDGVVYADVCTVSYSGLTSYDCFVPANSTTKNYYRVLQRDIDGRSAYSQTVLLRSHEKSLLTIHPNPAKDKLYIDGLSGYRTVEIADATGKLVQRLLVVPGMQYTDISRLGAGLYWLTVTGDSKKQTFRFIKN
jgi:hypothetical protein